MAFVFSLLASDEIFKGIPEDRRRLVVVSYTLITLGLVAAFSNIGPGLMPLVVSGALVFAAVNLMVWILLSGARGEGKPRHRTGARPGRPDVAHAAGTACHRRVRYCGDVFSAQEVGGDFYDYSCLGQSGELAGLWRCSTVSGKGIEAAMSAVFASGAYSSEARLSANRPRS